MPLPTLVMVKSTSLPFKPSLYAAENVKTVISLPGSHNVFRGVPLLYTLLIISNVLSFTPHDDLTESAVHIKPFENAS